MKAVHRARFSLICSIAVIWILAPQLAHAQLDIHVVPNDEFAVIQPKPEAPLIEFLMKGTTLRAETRRSTDVVLFVVRASNGKVVAQGQTRPFGLDPRTASTSSGMRLGSVVSVEQLLRLPPLASFEDAIAASVYEPEQSIGAVDLTANPGAAFGLPGLNPGIFGEQEHVLLIGVVPADPGMRERAQTKPLVIGIASQ